jgi:hypothetical protein
VSLWAVRLQIVFLAKQTDDLARSIAMSAEVAHDTLFASVGQAVLDHPEVGAVLEGAARPRARRATVLRARSVAEMLCDAMERTLALSGVTGTEPRTRAWIADTLAESPFVRAWLLEHGRWYTDDLVSYAVAASA